MYPQTHFLASLLIGMVFSKIGFFDYKVALFVGFVGMLVDVDHFIIFVLKYKEIDFRHAWNKAVGGLYHGRSFIHHWIGIVLMTLIVIVLYFYKLTLFWIIGLGYFSHLFVDYAHLNVLRIRERMTIREEGFVMKIDKFEVLLDISLVVGIVLLFL